MEIIARLAADETLGDRIIKVNHAGEHGAVNIYWAQLLACWWRKSDLKFELREFLDHEK
jgi:3-demethoxyubiquinol 3-hydroxylase